MVKPQYLYEPLTRHQSILKLKKGRAGEVT
jgi:hypothetical protein